jgi:NADPH:quinone reductase-like Zn-dependent oxidoreductase
MAAFVLMRHGGLDDLEYHSEWPTPVAEGAEVLIKVSACGLNNTDVNTRSGWYSKSVDEATTGGAYAEVDSDDPTWGGAPMSLPRIQGADVVGTVVACGPDANTDLIGKRVMTDGWLRDWDDPLNKDRTGYFGSECDGGFAEFTKTDFRNVAAVESALSDAELATFSCSYSTAEGMLNRANVGPKDRILITGASGGVGSALIQLAKRRGAMTIAMASEAKHKAVHELAPGAILPRNSPDLGASLKEATGHDTVTVVADIVGGDYFPTLINVLTRGGRYTCSGAIAGPIVSLDLRTFYLRDLTFTGSTVIPPHVFADLVSYIEKREIKPLLAATYPLKDLRKAQQAFIDKRHTGNIVVTL